MKQLTALAICLFAAGTMSAQNNAAKQKTTTAPKVPATQTSAATQKGTATKKGATSATKAKKIKGPGVEGFIRDGHKHPLDDVHAFIYGKDSSIAASGFTDATGHYETNAVLPGVYSVKYVYPEAKYILVTGVEIKKGLTLLDISMDPPASDTSVGFTTLMPPPEKKPVTHTPKKK